MKKWYCVEEIYDKKGMLSANISDVVLADERPVGTFKIKFGKHVYHDWYGNLKEAAKSIEEAKTAREERTTFWNEYGVSMDDLKIILGAASVFFMPFLMYIIACFFL